MFKKTDIDENRTEPSLTPRMPRETPTAAPPAPAPERPKERAMIGASITIKGDLAGEEDLLIQGTVEGTISLRDHLVTVGKEGRLNATVHARSITVQGKVQGDLNGNEQVVVERSGIVSGNIIAPRVTLENGCQFNGSVDMKVEAADSAKAASNVADLKPVAATKDEASPASPPKPPASNGGSRDSRRQINP